MADRGVAAASRREGPLSDALRRERPDAHDHARGRDRGERRPRAPGAGRGAAQGRDRVPGPAHGRPSTPRDGPGRVVRPGPCRGRDPGVHVLLPAGQPGRGTSPRPDPARAEPVGQAGERLDRRARHGSGVGARPPHHPGADRPPHRGEAARGRRAPVADRRAAGAAGGPVARDLRGAGGRAPDARGDRGPVAHGSDPPAPARAARRGARGAGAVRPDDLHDAPGDLSGDGQHARPGRLRHAAAVVRAVPAMGHVGGRRSRRQPARDGRDHARGDGDPIRSRVARAGGRLAADRADALGLGERRPSEPGAPPGAGPRRRGAARRRAGAGADALGRAASAQARPVGAPAGRDPDGRDRRLRRAGVLPDGSGRPAAVAGRGRRVATGLG